MDERAKHASDNEIEIVKSKQAGCFFCRHLFSAREVKDWVSDEHGVHAICPECGMSSVIGDASGIELSKETLKEIGKSVFGTASMKSNPSAMKTYICRFEEGKIKKKPHTIDLYWQYLETLASQGDQAACLTMGDKAFQDHDFVSAVKWFTSPSLLLNQNALNSLGDVYSSLTPEDSKEDGYKRAFECYAKACALGDLRAVYKVADCFVSGTGVSVDPFFALESVSRAYEEAYDSFLHRRRPCGPLGQFAIRLGRAYESRKKKSSPGDYDSWEYALRFYLLAEFAFESDDGYSYTEDKHALSQAKSAIKRIAAKYQCQREEPRFDMESFSETAWGGQDIFSLNTLANISFDEENSILMVDVDYENEPLIYDLFSLYVGFGPKNISWAFYDVIGYSIKDGTKFNRVDTPDGSSYLFIRVHEDGTEEKVGEILIKPGER